MEKILNEKKYAELLLSKGIILDNRNVSTAAWTLSKYYIVEGLKKKEVKNRVLSFLKDNYKKYEAEVWEVKVEKDVSKIIRNKRELEKKESEKDEDERRKYKLFEIDNIYITLNELERIKVLEDIEIEKLAFVMLVSARINQIKHDSKTLGIKCSKELFQEAGLKFLKNTSLIYSLYKNEYIDINDYHLSKFVEVKYGDDKSLLKVKDDGINIVDFRDIALLYSQWRGERVKNCACGRIFQPNNNKHKLCESCKKEVHLENQRKAMNSLRSRINV